MASPFETSRDHLYAELARLDLCIQREVWRWRQATSPAPQPGASASWGDEFRGLYISEGEVDAILSGVYPGSPEVVRQVAGQETERAFQQAIEQATARIGERKAASAEQGIPLRLEQLRASFGLTSFDVDVLLVGLAPELELRYERLYAYLQDDVTRKRPGVALVLNLLCPTQEERVAARARFAASAPFLQHHLIALLSDPAHPQPPLLAQYVKPDPRVVDWLLEAEGPGSPGALDARLEGFCELLDGGGALDALYLPREAAAELERLAADPLAAQVSRPPIVLLLGDEGSGKRAAAQAVCAAWGRPLLAVHLPRVLAQGRTPGQVMQWAAREAHLRGAALYWDGYDVLVRSGEDQEPERALRREALHAALVAYPVPHFLPIEDADRQPDSDLLRAPRLVRVRFARPSYALRRALWEHLVERYPAAPDVDLAAVAGRFRLTGQQIHDAVLDAHHRAAQREPGQQVATTDDLFAAARARTSEQLVHLAQKIEPRHTWEDLVLPEDPISQLHEMCDQMRYRPLVLGEWGFDRKLSLGKGLNALFAGPSGTGKTMAAEVIAHDLGLDLYKIDLSTVVSKYIGETEKNLDRIFRAARNSNAILFFDEADALFGKRSEVRDAHDRYANVEISYLLQKMEEYDGLVVLTSNLNKNMDEAFVRRMHFTVEFPYPEAEARRRIWEIAFPAEAPLAPGVDLGLLAERYRVTGGNIRNIALTAAFLAARDGSTIEMDHLLRATRREYQKMGRLADEREFELG
jgi:ATP-dependent 26S proteasome regulatory subunit